MSMTRKEQARALLNLRGIDHAKWSAEEVRRLFDLISGLAYEEPEAGVPAGMVLYGPEHPDYPNAPSDWDNGPYLCRDGGMYHMRGYGWEHGKFCSGATSDWDRVAYTPKQAAPTDEAILGDTARLDFLAAESFDLRCFPVPTGGGDADIGWRVVGHWEAEPNERTIAEVFHDDPRAAIDAARPAPGSAGEASDA